MNVLVSKLRPHPAQMRTVTRVMALAQLALQMRKPDPNLPLLVLPVEDEFVVISGHRRWLAAMIASLTEEPTVEAMVATVEKACHPHNGLIRLDEELYKEVLALLPADFELPAAEWSDEEGKDVLGLLRANVGAEEPDLLGQSFCLTQAVALGYDIEELAQAAGLPVAKVQAIIDIRQLQTIYQEMLQDGRLDLEAVPSLIEMKHIARDGLQKALAEIIDQGDVLQPGENYTGQIVGAMIFIQSEPAIPDRQTTPPERVNRGLVARGLWRRALEEDPGWFYYLVATSALITPRSPNDAQAYLNILAKVPDYKKYFFAEWRLTFGGNALETLPDASCSTCHFFQLPQDQFLHYELEIPCRKKARERPRSLPEDRRCWSWAPAAEPFAYRLPYSWSRDSGKEVTTLKALLKAWERQKAWEDKEGLPLKSANGEDVSEDTSAMDLQRAAIRAYMEQHTQPPFTVDHPWATACETCKYHLTGSPVKSDPDAPWCRWARGRQKLTFEARVPEEDGLPWIPFCHQYAPQEGWASIIPSAESGGPFPRDVMMDLVLKLANSTNSRVYDITSHGVVQFLTGRPESASGNHHYTFEQWYKLQVKDLSDAQLYTLFQWVSCYWLARQSGLNDILIPYDGLLVSCVHRRFDVALRQEQKEPDEEGDDLG